MNRRRAGAQNRCNPVAGRTLWGSLLTAPPRVWGRGLQPRTVADRAPDHAAGPPARWPLTLLLAVALTGPVQAEPTATVVVVVGAPGKKEYEQQFATWADRWAQAAREAGASLHLVGRQGSQQGHTDRETLRALLARLPKKAPDPLWLVLIGHGTFDTRTARFNLRGPDVSASDLAQWLHSFQRPLILINCASCSGPFINCLSGRGRVVVTATRSGNELNFARFGGYLSAAIADPAADYDKDGQTSLLEAFLAAARSTADYYRSEGRLATEHALLDDNGDGLGTPADWFRGIRAVKRAKDGAGLDGHRARQIVLVPSERERRIPPELRAERDRLELAVAALRERKGQLPEAEYYDRLEAILLKLARLHQRIERTVGQKRCQYFGPEQAGGTDGRAATAPFRDIAHAKNLQH